MVGTIGKVGTGLAMVQMARLLLPMREILISGVLSLPPLY